MMNDAAAKHMSSFTVNNLDEKSGTDDSFNQSDNDEEDGAESQLDQMKITTSKLPPPRVTAPHGFGVQ